MDGEAIKTLVQFVLAMAGIMGLIWVIAAITPFLARKIDERLKKPSPERVEDSNDKTEEGYKVKGLYDKSEMENFDPNYKIYNTDIYGIESLTKRAQAKKEAKSGTENKESDGNNERNVDNGKE